MLQESQDKYGQSLKPNWLKYRVMRPVIVSLLMVVGVSLFLFINLIFKIVEDGSVYDSTGMDSSWQMDMYHHQGKLGIFGYNLSQHPQIRAAVKAGDHDQLLNLGMPIFTAAKNNFVINYLVVINAERRVLVRYHAPEIYGDKITHQTILEAEASRKEVYGLVFGSDGRLIQRVITPILEHGRIIGYIAVGEPVDDFLHHLDATFKVRHVAIINKSYMMQSIENKISDARSQLFDNERFPNKVVIGNTIGDIPTQVLERIMDDGLHLLNNGNFIESNSHYYSVMILPVMSNKDGRIGNVIVFKDVSEQYLAIRNSIIVASSVIALVVAGLLIALFRITRRTESRFTEAYNDLKQTHVRLDIGQQYWDDAFNAIDDPMFIHNEEFRVIRANRAYAKQAGMALQDIIGRHYYECFPKSDKPMPECVEALQSNIYDEDEHSIQIADGSSFLSRGFVTHNKHGAYMHSIHILQDVTKERQVKHELKVNAEKLKSIMSAIPVGFGVVSKRNIQFVNDKVCDILGYSHEELIGKDTRMLYPDEDEYERVGRVKYADIKTSGSGVIECRMQCKDGRIIDILLSSSAFDQHDLVKGVTFSMMDISDRKAHENKLAEHVDELQRFMKVSLGREDRIKELRDENRKLKDLIQAMQKAQAG